MGKVLVFVAVVFAMLILGFEIAKQAKLEDRGGMAADAVTEQTGASGVESPGREAAWQDPAAPADEKPQKEKQGRRTEALNISDPAPPAAPEVGAEKTRMAPKSKKDERSGLASGGAPFLDKEDQAVTESVIGEGGTGGDAPLGEPDDPPLDRVAAGPAQENPMAPEEVGRIHETYARTMAILNKMRGR